MVYEKLRDYETYGRASRDGDWEGFVFPGYQSAKPRRRDN